jgi:hypothetical protein
MMDEREYMYQAGSHVADSVEPLFVSADVVRFCGFERAGLI